MNIIKLEGNDQRLYYLVAHLVMDETVLSYNLNYPYKTSSEFRWFIAADDKGNTLGFIPVKRKEGKAVINNYYVGDDDKQIFYLLLKEIIRDLLPDFAIEAVTQIKHIPFFEECGFAIELYWKRYAKMKAFRNDEKCL